MHRVSPLPAPVLAVVLTFLLVLATLPPSTQAASPPDIELTPLKVSTHTYYFQGETGAASHANRGFMSNAGFTVTRDGVVVYDALATPALGAAMLRAIRKVTKVPVKVVIVGHYHADHIYGLQALRGKGVTIAAHRNGRAYLASDAAKERLAQRRAELAPWVNEQTELVAADRWLDFADGQPWRFELGGLHFRVLDSSGAHSPEDLQLLVEEDKVLFAGDLFFSGRIPFVGNADSKRWLQALDRMLDVQPAVVIPGHGPASTNPRDDMLLTQRYLRYLREQMGNAVQELLSFEEAYARTDWTPFKDYPAFAQANRLNAYGTYLLMEQESLESSKEPSK
ncbi:MBL fold metallo-hydrolase [Duganella ginsengisoli]|uniref:MBL fold metallo-hydrolase n=2 Tax=Pseudoduganella ginsengisoli TaxID=1462440 RepID=A0A6L6PVD0_9BURK|nr:MBL fold metallo-hydrolase [Pseudoduganella ginsengisoli]